MAFFEEYSEKTVRRLDQGITNLGLDVTYTNDQQNPSLRALAKIHRLNLYSKNFTISNYHQRSAKMKRVHHQYQ